MAGAHGELKLAEGIANGVHCVAHGKLVAVTEGDRIESFSIYLQNRDVVVLFGADDGRDVFGAVMGHDVDVEIAFVGVLYHVVVRDDVAVGGGDEAGAADSGGACHAEEVAVGDLTRDADDLLAGKVIYARCGHCAACGAAHRGCAAGVDDQLFFFLVKLCYLAFKLIHPAGVLAAHYRAAGEAAEQCAYERDAYYLYPAAAGALSLRLLGFLDGLFWGSVVFRRNGAFILADIVRIGINLLGISVFVMIFAVDSVGRVGLWGRICAFRGCLLRMFIIIRIIHNRDLLIFFWKGTCCVLLLFTCLTIQGIYDVVMNKVPRNFKQDEYNV